MVPNDPYEKIDPALLPLFDFLKLFSDLDATYSDQPEAMTITDMTLTLPLDLEIINNEDGSLTLGGSSPGMYGPIALAPIYHRLKITIAVTDESITE